MRSMDAREHLYQTSLIRYFTPQIAMSDLTDIFSQRVQFHHPIHKCDRFFLVCWFSHFFPFQCNYYFTRSQDYDSKITLLTCKCNFQVF